MQASASVSFLHKHFSGRTHPLTEADGVQILGATLFYLREKDVVSSLSAMHANNSAQGTLEMLRFRLWCEAYGGTR
jgi:hypothetical protein